MAPPPPPEFEGPSWLGEDEPEFDMLTLAYAFIGVVVMVGLAACILPCAAGCTTCCCRCFCCGFCRRRFLPDAAPAPTLPDTVIIDGEPVAKAHFRQKKEHLTAYALWMCAGLTGAHHFYLDRLVHGLFCLWTLNFLSMGWMCDFWLMPMYISGANRGSSPAAIADGSSWRVVGRLPLALLTALAAFAALFIKVPTWMQDAGVVDIQQVMANTTQNPYDLLGVERGTLGLSATIAYRDKLAKLEARGPCDAKCRDRKQDLKRALDFIVAKPWRRDEAKASSRGRRRSGGAPAPGTAGLDAWDEWADFKLASWKALTDVVARRGRAFAEKWIRDEGEAGDGAEPPDATQQEGASRRKGRRAQPADSEL